MGNNKVETMDDAIDRVLVDLKHDPEALEMLLRGAVECGIALTGKAEWSSEDNFNTAEWLHGALAGRVTEVLDAGTTAHVLVDSGEINEAADFDWLAWGPTDGGNLCAYCNDFAGECDCENEDA